MDRDRQIFLPDGLVLKESSIHGLGIFTTKDFPADYRFGDFTGKTMSITDFISQYGKDTRYCYRMTRSHTIIVAKEERNFITYINDGIHLQPVNGTNVYCKKKGLYSLRAISSGEELLLDYGKDYLWSAH